MKRNFSLSSSMVRFSPYTVLCNHDGKGKAASKNNYKTYTMYTHLLKNKHFRYRATRLVALYRKCILTFAHTHRKKRVAAPSLATRFSFDFDPMSSPVVSPNEAGFIMRISPNSPRKETKKRQVGFPRACLFSYMLYFFLKRSIRPPASASFCLPV